MLNLTVMVHVSIPVDLVYEASENVSLEQVRLDAMANFIDHPALRTLDDDFKAFVDDIKIIDLSKTDDENG